jgi:radical SAM-linked protein
LSEIVELDLTEPLEPEQVHQRLVSTAPDGLAIAEVRTIDAGAAKARVQRMRYRFPIPEQRQSQVRQAAEELLAQPTWFAPRTGRPRPVDLRADLESVEVREGSVHFCIRATNQASVRPGDVLSLLGLTDLTEQGCFLTRTEVELTS